MLINIILVFCVGEHHVCFSYKGSGSHEMPVIG